MPATFAATARKAVLAVAALGAAPTIAEARVRDPGLYTLSTACFSIQSQWDAAHAGFTRDHGISTPEGRAHHDEINRLWGLWRSVCQGVYGDIYQRTEVFDLGITPETAPSLRPLVSPRRQPRAPRTRCTPRRRGRRRPPGPSASR